MEKTLYKTGDRVLRRRRGQVYHVRINRYFGKDIWGNERYLARWRVNDDISGSYEKMGTVSTFSLIGKD